MALRYKVSGTRHYQVGGSTTRVWYAMYAHTDGHERKTARLSFTGN